MFLQSYPATGSGIVESKDHRDCISPAGLTDFFGKATQSRVKEIVLCVRIYGNKPVWIGFSKGRAEMLEQRTTPIFQGLLSFALTLDDLGIGWGWLVAQCACGVAVIAGSWHSRYSGNTIMLLRRDVLHIGNIYNIPTFANSIIMEIASPKLCDKIRFDYFDKRPYKNLQKQTCY